MGANELSQATEYAYIAMSANADYASEYAAGMLAALTLLAQKLQSDVEELSREIRKLRASYNTESGSFLPAAYEQLPAKAGNNHRRQKKCP